MERDVYADLLNETRQMRRDQSRARDRWYAALRLDSKEKALFELEMLLKSFACFSNPRNHTGPAREVAIAAHDYRPELAIVLEGLDLATTRVRELLGERDRAFVFSRYLETVVPEDGRRHELLQQQLTQHTPEESLFVLRNAFASFAEIGLALSGEAASHGRVKHRVFQAFINTVTREVGRSEYFNPLQTLEFRAEFDRIRAPGVLAALHRATAASHRLSAMAFLSLFRLLRYLDVVDRYASTSGREPLAFLMLSVFRSDARAIAHILEDRAGVILARGFEQGLYQTSAAEMHLRHDALQEELLQVRSLQQAMSSVGRALRLEGDLVSERDLPTPRASADESLGPQLVLGTAALRTIVHHGIISIARELDESAEMDGFGSLARRSVEASVRLRRDVWTFKQVLRAFLAKAAATHAPTDRWSSVASFGYVREFLRHFQAIGYQLARRSDYPDFDRFIESVGSLREVDLLEPSLLDDVIEQCRNFQLYLEELFKGIDSRAELHEHPFDRIKAAAHLKAYLGAA